LTNTTRCKEESPLSQSELHRILRLISMLKSTSEAFYSSLEKGDLTPLDAWQRDRRNLFNLLKVQLERAQDLSNLSEPLQESIQSLRELDEKISKRLKELSSDLLKELRLLEKSKEASSKFLSGTPSSGEKLDLTL
jgi:hypothetical protein